MFNITDWVGSLSVAEDTKVLLNELILRREKERQLKLRLIFLTVINAVNIIIIAFWLSKINGISGSNIFDVIDYLSSSKASIIFLVLVISIIIYANSVSREHKKKKDKYDALREEVSRKLSASWKVNEDSKMKDEISGMLKKHKDINIRYLK